MMFHRLGLILNRQARRGVAPSKTPLPPRLRKERGTPGVRLIHKSQRGFTLIELLVAIAITGLITGGLTMTIFQVFTVNALSNNHMLAVRQVQNAGYWVSRDAQMAQDVAPDPGGTGFPLILTWTDWETGDVYQVEYTLDLVDNKLQRSYSVDDGSTVVTTETIVAQFIDSAETDLNFTDGKLTLTVTAALSGWQPASETRTYEVIPRPDEVY